MNLVATEGTVASYHDPSFYLPGHLASDAPGRHPGRIVRIDYDPIDGWRANRHDSYLKTGAAIPLRQISMVSARIVTIRTTVPWEQDLIIENVGY